MWAMDFSTFESLCYDPAEEIVVSVDERDGYYRRKVAGTAAASRVWVGAAVDYATGVIYADVFPGRAESLDVAAEFFCACASEKDWSLRGLPGLLYTDPAPWAHRSGAFYRTLTEKLGVCMTHHKPGSPASKGRVEVIFRHLAAFESAVSSAIRLSGGRMQVERFRAYLHAWVREWNRRYGRIEKYNAAGIRAIGLDPALFLRSEVRRVQPDRTVEFKGARFWVPPGVPPGSDVEIFQLHGTVYAVYAGTRWELVAVDGTPVYPFRDGMGEELAIIRQKVQEALEGLDTDVLVQMALGWGENIIPFVSRSSERVSVLKEDWGTVGELLPVPPP
jgi:hypothetical protein